MANNFINNIKIAFKCPNIKNSLILSYKKECPTGEVTIKPFPASLLTFFSVKESKIYCVIYVRISSHMEVIFYALIKRILFIFSSTLIVFSNS